MELSDSCFLKEGVQNPRGTTSMCGSIPYLAPEAGTYLESQVLAKAGHGPLVDVYGLGVLCAESQLVSCHTFFLSAWCECARRKVLLYEMLIGVSPYYSRDKDLGFAWIFGHEDTLLRNIMEASLEIPCYVSHRAGTCIRGLMKRIPSQRLGAHRTADVREHIFFSGGAHGFHAFQH
eukprot:286718-Amphidinium_carterae.1